MSNCLFYAIHMVIREGGYVCFVRSTRWWGLHVVWMNRARTEIRDYVPTRISRPYNRLVPKLLFRGRVRFVSLR